MGGVALTEDTSRLSAIVLGTFLMFASIAGKAEMPHEEAALSLNKIFRVTIYPLYGEKLIGQYHSWVVHVETPSGKFIENLRLGVFGGMAAHGHGLPTKPQMTRYLGNGDYLVEGVLFNMAGEWTLQFLVQTPQQTDRVRFEFDVSF